MRDDVGDVADQAREGGHEEVGSGLTGELQELNEGREGAEAPEEAQSRC
jgi:hypothetical protein